jgi:hypothetical protein
MCEQYQAFVTNASYHLKIISENTSDCISRKQFSTFVENQSTEQSIVAMPTHASNRISAEALSSNNIGGCC